MQLWSKLYHGHECFFFTFFELILFKGGIITKHTSLILLFVLCGLVPLKLNYHKS